MSLLSVTDASFANGVGDDGEHLRSQGGILIRLGNAYVFTKEHTHLHPLFHQSTTFKRVVRATCQAETCRMQLGVEHVDILRAGLADMFGRLDRNRWEERASDDLMFIVVFTVGNNRVWRVGRVEDGSK